MRFMAHVELGMTTEEFYLCTWYDWGFRMSRVVEQKKKRQEDHELLMEMVRSALCKYYNWNRGKNPPLNREDFWRLSYDQSEETNTQVRVEDAEQVEETIKRLERIAKKRKRG